MNELRWILLAAGVILIIALYLWGMRSRWHGRGDAAAARRPVFTGTATGFETRVAGPLEGDLQDDDADPVASRSESRRIEPSFGEGAPDDEDDAGMRRTGFLADNEELERPAIARREPTLSPTRTEPLLTGRQEPTLRAEPESPASSVREPTQAPSTQASSTQAEAPARRAQKILAIRVSAVPPARFDGADLRESLRAEGLDIGRYEIFHRLHEGGHPIFSVASLKEPGTFDIEAMPTTLYPGVALFAVLPGPVPAADAFDEMIFTARALATHLNGALADERGTPLTALRVGKLREEALDFERGSGTA